MKHSAASVSQPQLRLGVVLEPFLEPVLVALGLISDVPETVEAVPVVHKLCVLDVDRLNVQSHVLWFQWVALSYDHISHLLIQFFLNFLPVLARQKEIFL